MQYLKRIGLVAPALLIALGCTLLPGCGSKPAAQTPPKPAASNTTTPTQKPSTAQIAALAAVPSKTAVKGPAYETLLTASDVEQATGLTGLMAGPSG